LLKTAPGRIDFTLDGVRLACYRYDAGSAPGFTDLRACGRSLLRPADGQVPGIAILHGCVSGRPFGTDEEECGGIYEDSTVARRGGQSCGFRQECVWIGRDGERVLTDVRTVRAAPGPAQGAVIDVTIQVAADADVGVELGRTEAGLLRIAPASALTPAGGGQLRNSLGEYGFEAIHGRAAAWCACVGVIDGETVGMAILDHPNNPWHPTPWLAQSGVLSPSPFPWRSVRIEPFDPLILRYRILAHEGYVDEGWADERLKQYEAESL
jgi:hypothetical protein